MKKKTKSYNKKAPNGGKVEMSAEHVVVFSQNLVIKAYTAVLLE